MYVVVDDRGYDLPEVYLFASIEDACRGYHTMFRSNKPFVINEDWWEYYLQHENVWIVPVKDARHIFHQA